MKVSRAASIRDVLGRDAVHPFPARMAPGIALDVLRYRRRQKLRVLDPMMGSGTALAVARSEGHSAIGIDIDPLAVLTAGVWTSTIVPKAVRARALKVLDRARARSKKLKRSQAYPYRADESTRKFVRYWFDSSSRRQLAALAQAIRCIRDKKKRNALWCAFSRLIITKQAGASLAMDLSHSRPHRAFETAPTKPFDKFLSSVEHVIKNCVTLNAPNRGPAVRVLKGDARRTRLVASSIDLVLTSPPYLNAIDYMRCSKFTLVWMGHSIEELSDLRSKSIGAEVGQRESPLYATKIIEKLNLTRRLSPRHKAILTRFIHDMHCAITETSRVLVPGGRAVYVVGENTIRGVFIRNADIISDLARIVGLKLRKRKSRRLTHNRRYLPPPLVRKTAAKLDNRMRREVLLIFGKPKPRRKRACRQR